MELEDEPWEGGRDGEEIDVFSSPSQEDRFGGIDSTEVRRGLSPVTEVDEDDLLPDSSSVRSSSGKKKVRWGSDVKLHDASKGKGVNRLPPGWQVEDQPDEDMGEGDGNKINGDVSGGKTGVSPFGEGFFDSDSSAGVGFQVWKDGV